MSLSQIIALRNLKKTLGFAFTVPEIQNSTKDAVEEQGGAIQEIALNIENTSAGTRGVAAKIQGITQIVQETGKVSSAVLNAPKSS